MLLGSQLSPGDLPPPRPEADPREPPPSLVPGRGSRTPQKARSPAGSRSTSPAPPSNGRAPPSDPAGLLAVSPSKPPPLHHPKPISPSNSGSVPILPMAAHHHHLSRPSSPASIQSHSSAIFERDIEFPTVSSLSLDLNSPPQHTLSHKPSRLLPHGSALDHAVPAVLDDAVEALTGEGMSRGFEGLEIEAPATPSAIGMARQSSANLASVSQRKVSTAPGHSGLAHSRSVSPVSIGSRGSSNVAISPAQSPPILGQLATHQAMSGAANRSAQDISPTGSVPRPAFPQRISTGPQIPGGWAFEEAKEVLPLAESPEQATANLVDHPETQTELSPASPSALPPHLMPAKEKRRISYISYNDLLLSVPTTVTPLEDITSGNLSPDHLPGTVSPSMSTRSPIIPSASGPGSLSPAGVAPAARNVEHRASWDAGPGGRTGGLGLGEGEWSREGLGKGLEQRLEGLVHTGR